MWGIGDCIWHYYQALGQSPFPSLADIGYSSLPPLIFLGLLLQPSPGSGTLISAGWPCGIMIIGLGAYLRRFLPATSAALIEQRVRRRTKRVIFGPEQLVPYLLLGILFVVLVLDTLSSDKGQLALRPVLLFATISVVGLVVVRQILTIRVNAGLYLEAHSQRQYFEALMNVCPVAVASTDIDNAIVACNP